MGASPYSSLLSDEDAIYTPQISEWRDGASLFYHFDGSGSLTRFTDETGGIFWIKGFFIFGEVETGGSGGPPTPFGWHGGGGHETDSGSGYVKGGGGDYYDPGLGAPPFPSAQQNEVPEGWTGYHDPFDWLGKATNFFAGWGDELTFGCTDLLREGLGVNGVVDHDSGWYHGGSGTGFVHQLALPLPLKFPRISAPPLPKPVVGKIVAALR